MPASSCLSYPFPLSGCPFLSLSFLRHLLRYFLPYPLCYFCSSSYTLPATKDSLTGAGFEPAQTSLHCCESLLQDLFFHGKAPFCRRGKDPKAFAQAGVEPATTHLKGDLDCCESLLQDLFLRALPTELLQRPPPDRFPLSVTRIQHSGRRIISKKLRRWYNKAN